MVVAPVIGTPTPPDPWDCHLVEGSPDVLGTAWGYNPGDLTELEIAGVGERAVEEVAAWHRIASASPIPTPPWQQLLSPGSHSGHKLHIACSTFTDVQAVVGVTFGVALLAGCGMKAATSRGALAGGKGVVIYLPRRDTVDRDASLVADVLQGYRPSSPVVIKHGTHLGGAVWWRHEFGGLDPGYDVFDPREYRSLYVRAGVEVGAA